MTDLTCPTCASPTQLQDAGTGERVCWGCSTLSASPLLTAPAPPVKVACLHTGARLPYRPQHGMELCAACGLTVPARMPG